VEIDPVGGPWLNAREMRHLVTILLALAVGCGGGQAEPQEPAPQPAADPAPEEPAPAPEAEPAEAGPPLVARNFEVPPGKFAEANLELAAGVEVTAAFRADGAVEWNVHSHPEGGVAIHQEGAAADGKITFTAPTPGGYSWLWTNKGESSVNLIISIELPDGARIVSWQPDEDAQ
jgi:hypothetical protein